MLAIYIGSFNPITNAHLTIAKASLKYASKCIFVPVSDLYQKASLNVNALDRLSMIQCAIQNEPRFEVSDIEIKIAQDFNHQNKTLETLRLLKEKYQDELAFIIGADNLINLKSWYRYQELLSEFKVIVISRDEYNVREIIDGDLELKSFLKDAFILDDIHIDISSRDVRERLYKNQNVNGLIDANVIKYIEKNGLYRSK